MNVNIFINKQVLELEAYVESSEEGKYYKIYVDDELKWICSCPQGKYKGKCKHIEAVKQEAV